MRVASEMEYALQDKVTRWWDEEDAVKKANYLVNMVGSIKTKDSVRQAMCVQNARVYGETSVFGYAFRDTEARTSRVVLNLARQVTDEVVSRVTKHKPRPIFLTSGGNRSLRRKAKRLTEYVDYAMEEGDALAAFNAAATDAGALGDGFVHVFRDGTKVCYERILPSEILVDPQEGLYGSPMTMYRTKWAPKDALLGAFPDTKAYPERSVAIIRGSEPAADSHDFVLTDHKDLRVVYEAWRLPVGDEPGSHIIATDKGVLVDEEWEHDSFPIIHIQYSRNLFGYYGRGIVEDITPLHVTVNRDILKRQKILDLVAVPRIFFEGKGPKSIQFNNMIGGTYHGRPPVILNPPTVPPELNTHIEWGINMARMRHGLGLIGEGQLPPGVTSGVAMREYDSILDGQMAPFHLAFQKAWVEAAQWTVRMGKEIAKENPKWSPVASSDRYTVYTVPWKEVNLDKDDYITRCFPASSLPTHPGARKQEVIDLLQSGLLPDLGEARRLLDFPDMEKFASLDRAQNDYLDWVMERILDEGEAVAPEPFQDHSLALKRAMSEYNRAAQEEGVPYERIRLLIGFMNATRDLIKQQQAEQAQIMAPAATGAPPATGFGGAPPTAVQAGDGLTPQQ